MKNATLVQIAQEPQSFGLDVPEPLMKEAYIMRPELSPMVGWETGRQSEPAFMDMNLHSTRGSSTPEVVLYQYDLADPMNPLGLLVAYAEAHVLPVVSDFDTFLVGSMGMEYSPLPKDQQDLWVKHSELMQWCLDHTADIIGMPQRKSWTTRWLEVLKDEATTKGVVAMDGRPPLWVQEHDVPDSWAYVVLGERYSATGGESTTVLLGWHAQTVTYEVDLSHFIGTDQIGSEFSEREALFWSALWRLSINLDTPTVFRSDSVTSATQSIGLAGSCDAHPTYKHLRCIMQALQAALPADCFAVEHVRGHAGDVWNEFADYLAKTEAATGHRLTHQKVHMPQFCQFLPYLWMLFDRTAGLPVATRTGFDVCPPQLPPVACPDTFSSPIRSQNCPVQFSLSLATLNVGSLFTGPDGFGGKLQYLREQFHTHCFNVLGLQETRSPAGMSTVDDVLRLSSGSDKGHHGVELWLSLKQPFGHCGNTAVCIRKNHVQVLHADPRRLLARLAHPSFHCFFLVLHGPQSGRALHERRDWWSDTQELVSRFCSAHPLYVLMDANAKTGPMCEPIVFSHDDASSANTDFMIQFLSDNALCLPCTCDIHAGLHHTWTAVDGLSFHRIDYVAIPQEQLTRCVYSAVLDSLEPGTCLDDHRAVGLQLQWSTSHHPPDRSKPSQMKFNRHSIRAHRDCLQLQTIQAADWTADIESQVRAFNHDILHSLHAACPPSRASQKKPFISDSVWSLRQTKLQLQRRLRQARWNQRQDHLRLAFWVWSHRQSGSPSEPVDVVLASHAAHTVSITCSFVSLTCRYIVTARHLKRELQQCKQLHLQSELDTTTDKTSAGELLHLLKPFLGSSNPKKQKKAGLPSVRKGDGSICTTPDEATARWTEFFGRMEGGTPLSSQDYRRMWLDNLARFRATGPFQLSLSEVPSLVELEAAFRRVAVGKAVGEDSIPPEICRYKAVDLARITYPMLLKAFLFGQEAMEHKGGRLAVAWKHRGDARDCQTHRSLLVSSHIGKTIHRALRQRHHSLYTAYMQAQQLGGRPHMPVGIPLHLSRAFMRWQKRLHRPTSLIFLDLTEAFYRIVRPFALGGCLSDEDIATIASRLGFAEDTLHQFHAQLAQPSAIQQAGASPFVQRFLQALHSDTWFRIGPDGPLVRTTIGSRPGDSYADVVFGLLWAKLLHRYEQLLIEHDVLEMIPVHDFPDLFTSPDSSESDVMRVPYLGPTWMDDLNVCLAADSNLALERKTSFALSLLLDLCQDLHMQPNLCKGKTEVMFTFRGAEARSYRRKYFSDACPLKVIGEHQVYAVSVVSRYLHLGSLLHHRDVDRVEVTRRLAIAHQAFTTHRRLLYHNPRIAWDKRREIFGSLILSKLVYGLESWTLSSQKVKDQFYSGVMRLYRRLLKLPHDSHSTDLELLTAVGLPLPDELLRGCRLRYFGTLHNCGAAAHWGLLREDTTWTDLLKADFQWLWAQLHNTVALGDPSQHYAAWKDVLVFHGGYWKKLIKRATAHAIGQRSNHQLALSFHRQTGETLLQYGWVEALPLQVQTCAPSDAFGCMMCGTRHLSHAGECVHMFKCHQRVAPARCLFDETHCPACLREFHARSKVLAHLRHAHRCRQTLLGRRIQCPVMPGVGSAVDRDLGDRHDGALPFQQAAGPVQLPARLRDFDPHSIPLFEGLYLCLLDLQDSDSLFDTLQQEIRQHAVCWTLCRKTLCRFLEEFSMEDAEPLIVPFETVVCCVQRLADPSTWPFLQAPCQRALHDLHGELPLWEQWYDELAFEPPASWTRHQPQPRSLTRQRVILHAYAGRRRRGDIEWYIDELSVKYPGVVLQVVSIDIIIDEVYGDIARASTRRFWLRHILLGHVVGFLAGPPCNTWSRARAHQLSQARGPRVVRTPATPWGIPSLSLRELSQVGIGTLLLGFAIQCLVALSMHSGAGFLEHPKEPDEPEHVSIWKLPIIRFLLNLPGFRLVHLSQGLWGAASAKPTTLLVLGMSNLEKYLHACRVTKNLPQGASVGRREDGGFKTAPLKEYPPSMCKGIAQALCEDLISMDCDQSTLPAEFIKQAQRIGSAAAAASKTVEIPKLGFGDPTSVKLIGDVVKVTESCGAIRHGAECFNFYFPQELDDEFMVVWDGYPDPPWKILKEPDLRTFLKARAKEGYCFPLNPVWPIRDKGWYEVLASLRKSPVELNQRSLGGRDLGGEEMVDFAREEVRKSVRARWKRVRTSVLMMARMMKGLSDQDHARLLGEEEDAQETEDLGRTRPGVPSTVLTSIWPLMQQNVRSEGVRVSERLEKLNQELDERPSKVSALEAYSHVLEVADDEELTLEASVEQIQGAHRLLRTFGEPSLLHPTSDDHVLLERLLTQLQEFSSASLPAAKGFLAQKRREQRLLASEELAQAPSGVASLEMMTE
eukprot:s21_g10.t1